MSDGLRYLNDDHYYEWGEGEGQLTIYSECCADRFSSDEELVLLRYLLDKHPQTDNLTVLRAEVERLRDEAKTDAARLVDIPDLGEDWAHLRGEYVAYSKVLDLDLIDKQREGQ